jgi:hypothetical protein
MSTAASSPVERRAVRQARRDAWVALGELTLGVISLAVAVWAALQVGDAMWALAGLVLGGVVSALRTWQAAAADARDIASCSGCRQVAIAASEAAAHRDRHTALHTALRRGRGGESA